MKIGCSEVPKPSYPPYFDQLSERYQPLCLIFVLLVCRGWRHRLSRGWRWSQWNSGRRRGRARSFRFNPEECYECFVIFQGCQYYIFWGSGEAVLSKSQGIELLNDWEELPDSMAGWCRLVKRIGELVKSDVRYSKKWNVWPRNIHISWVKVRVIWPPQRVKYFPFQPPQCVWLWKRTRDPKWHTYIWKGGQYQLKDRSFLFCIW